MDGVYGISEGRDVLGAGHSTRCCAAFLDWGSSLLEQYTH
jgi:hypothetical protein